MKIQDRRKECQKHQRAMAKSRDCAMVVACLLNAQLCTRTSNLYLNRKERGPQWAGCSLSIYLGLPRTAYRGLHNPFRSNAANIIAFAHIPFKRGMGS